MSAERETNIYGGKSTSKHGVKEKVSELERVNTMIFLGLNWNELEYTSNQQYMLVIDSLPLQILSHHCRSL